MFFNDHFQLEQTDSSNKNLCSGLTASILTHLLDMCDREWQHIGHESQFDDAKKK